MPRLIALFLLWFLPLAWASVPDDRPLPDLDSLLKEFRKTLRSDRLLLSQYTYLETVTERQRDKQGQIKKTEVRVFEVYPSLEEGETYRRLISRDGKALGVAELEKNDREQDQKVQERIRKQQREKSSERERHLAKEAEERKKEDAVIDEAFRLYQVSLQGREILDGQNTLRLDFTPRRDYKPRSNEARIFKKMAGRAWVSEADHQLVRLEAELIDTVSFGLGMLARLNKGAQAQFQRKPVNDEIWLPATARFSGSARILLVKAMNVDVEVQYSDYRKFTVQTSVSFSEPRPPQSLP